MPSQRMPSEAVSIGSWLDKSNNNEYFVTPNEESIEALEAKRIKVPAPSMRPTEPSLA